MDLNDDTIVKLMAYPYRSSERFLGQMTFGKAKEEVARLDGSVRRGVRGPDQASFGAEHGR